MTEPTQERLWIARDGSPHKTNADARYRNWQLDIIDFFNEHPIPCNGDEVNGPAMLWYLEQTPGVSRKLYITTVMKETGAIDDGTRD